MIVFRSTPLREGRHWIVTTQEAPDGAERHYLVTASSGPAVSSSSTAVASNGSATNQDEIAQHALMGGGVAGYSIGPKSA